MKARHEEIVGKYMYVTVQGIEYRIYYEEAGQGIPLVLGHTAGSDGREWHWMLNDEEVTKNFRLIAFDLPYHGKSLPSTSLCSILRSGALRSASRARSARMTSTPPPSTETAWSRLTGSSIIR